MAMQTSSVTSVPFEVPYSLGRYRRVYLERVLLVRWYGAAEAGDFQALVREAEHYARQRKSKVIHLAVQSPSHPPLSGEVRAEVMDIIPRVFDSFESFHNVVEGRGFSASAIRSVVLGFAMAAGLRGKVFVHPSLEAAFATVAPQVGLSAGELTTRARQAGLVL
jgi:hypothetical protein